MYFDGDGVDQDYSKAEYWYQKSAEQGNPEAQHNLGVIYYKGEGVARNFEKAKYWFERLSDLGNADAQVLFRIDELQRRRSSSKLQRC